MSAPDAPARFGFVGLGNMGRLLLAKGNYDAAEPLYREALAIFEKTLPPDHPRIQKTREKYASLLRAVGQDAEAEELEARAAAAKEGS